MKEYSFRYDLHVHTKETSRCGRIPATEMVQKYKELGYSGFVVTDHYNERLYEITTAENSGGFVWEQMIDRLLLGYRTAKIEGDRLNFQVLLGCELRFEENNNDYLIYGMTEDFFYKNRYLRKMGIHAFYKRFADELLIIQAHPYRDENEDVWGDCLHGVETVNLNVRHNNRNERAKQLALDFNLIETCGSDAHQPEDVGLGYVGFNRLITDSGMLADVLASRDFIVGIH